ncbi:MAG TPA: zinc metallopeptidase [Anaerolineae bacterium]|nr:zinc metallopeptidase [Anaerolineae bacterium]HID85207.1 zinc metallopeptidase [Anaerolineales bacterium]HIQ08342.1 zinc metallopeptidase [Anaerolineaceae bacterium]
MFWFDPYYLIFMAPAFILMMLAQWYVSSAFRKWSRVPVRTGLSGAEAAERLIRHAGLYGVTIEMTGGMLSDHYDPRNKVLRLSPGVYQGRSVASVAVAAHELGHALQDQEGYAALRLRTAMVPAVNFGSYLGWILILLGLFLHLTNLAVVGLVIFSLGAVFALITLPVEFNASARAKRLLQTAGIVQTEDEARGVNTVLNAAALTYVAALITAVMQVLYYALLIFGDRRRR